MGGSSDKEYHLQIELILGSGYMVNFQYGRRGGTMQPGTKTPRPVPEAEARRIFDRLVAEKTGKGYAPGQSRNTAVQPSPSRLKDDPDAMEAAITTAQAIRTKYPVEKLGEIGLNDVERFLTSANYFMQRKEDGERRQIAKTEAGVVGYNKLGNAVELPRVLVAEINRLNMRTLFLDGEIIGDRYIAWDLLMADGVSIASQAYETRLAKLTKLIPAKNKLLSIVPTWDKTAQKQGALALLKKNRGEGVAFKLKTAPYRAGIGSHKKFKFLKSASCYVSAVGINGKSNAELSLLDDRTGEWVEVAHASTIGKGKIEKGMIVEVIFLNATAGRRLYQPRIKEVREDVDLYDCTISRQLKPEVFKEGVQ
jgi:bifunctional non-homologous end joining protein LigD